MRLFLLDLLPVQGGKVDAEFASPALRLGKAQIALARGAEHLHPAGAPEQLQRAGLDGERLVLGDAVLDQLRVLVGDGAVPRRPRVVPVFPEKRRKPRNRRRMVVRVDRAVQAVAEQRAEVVREAVRIHTFALHQAGIAEGSLLRRAAAVEQDRGAPALLQMQRDAYAYDA